MTSPVFDHLTTLSEPIRVRMLRVLVHEELAVGELARVLQTSQPTVSRHLKQLDTGGWVNRRRVGTATYFRVLPAELAEDVARLWEVVRATVEAEAADPASTYAEDLRRLESVLAARSADSEELFRRLGGRWDDVRTELFGHGFVFATLAALLPPGLRIADLGCGTGALLPILAAGDTTVIGVDREAAMLEVASHRVAGLSNVSLKGGLLDTLPLDARSVDLAVCQLVLHHVKALGPVFADVARVLAPGGRFVVVDMVEHDREEYRDTMGHQHLGFGEELVRGLGADAGLSMSRWSVLAPDPAAQGPGLFLAVLQKSAG